MWKAPASLYLVDDISKGEVGHRHPRIAAQRHVYGVVVGAIHVVVQVDEVSHHLQTSCRRHQTEQKVEAKTRRREHVSLT